MYKFSLRFNWSLFPRDQLTIFNVLGLDMAWCRPCDKPLCEAMMVSLLTHICVTWPQWFKSNDRCWDQRSQFLYEYVTRASKRLIHKAHWIVVPKLVQVNNKSITKVPHHLVRETGGFPTQRASNARIPSMSLYPHVNILIKTIGIELLWRHHVLGFVRFMAQ